MSHENAIPATESAAGMHECRPRCSQCVRAASREYHRRNKHRTWLGGYKARMKALGLTPIVELFTYQDVVATYGNWCAYCPDGEFEELDHFIPLVEGGAHTLENVRPSCRRCNRAKSKTEGRSA